MCMDCWDKQKRQKALDSNEACSRDKIWKMSLQELKYKASFGWLKNGRTQFDVFKENITDLGDQQSMEWITSNGASSQKISVNFV